MKAPIPPDILPRARQILLPLVTTEGDREALLTEAFYQLDPLLYRIDQQGAAWPFAVRCVKTLLDYGALDTGEHSLARLLLIARDQYGVDKHAEIDELIAGANALCRTGEHKRPAPLSPPAAPAPLQTSATPRNERQPAVFLSYAHADREFADRLIADLRAAGHPCWIDSSALKGGDEWLMAIAEGIMNSYVMLVVTTRAAQQSRWVQDEILWARQKNKRIIPVLTEDVFGETRFFPLIGYQAETFYDKDYALALTRLLSALPSPVLSEMAEEPAPAGVPAPVPLPATITLPPRAVPRALELDYLERLRLEELLNTEKYTPLAGVSQQVNPRAEMPTVFALLQMTREDRTPRETRRFENAVAEIRELRRCVLLGEPGGGKTTTIWKLAADIATTALADPQAPIPLLIRLGRWTAAEQPLPDFIAAQLGELGAHLDTLLREKRAALLLDGLNEMPASQHRDKYAQMEKFIRAHPRLLAVVSCRELDYTIDLGFDRISITPLNPLQIREFARRYLGQNAGDALFWRLAGDRARQELKRFRENFADRMAEPERVFWTESLLPAGFHWGYEWRDDKEKGTKDNTLWQDWLRLRETPSSLMVLARNPYMLLMLTSVYAEQGALPDNRGQLFDLFAQTLLKRERIPAEQQAVLTKGLAQVAFQMQTQRARDDQGDALTVLPRTEARQFLDERLLYLAGSASILSVGEQVRFTHQLLQEYFAARAMDGKIRAGELDITDIWPSASWWERTNWEEAAVLLAGLYSDDCTYVVDWLSRGNPEVAAQCVARSGAALAPATRERLRGEWTPRLTDLQRAPDPRARAAVGRAIGLIGPDTRKGVGVARDKNGVPLPDIDWVEIPNGKFLYGDEKKELSLPTFKISRYPLTWAQFQTFVDDPEGITDPRWFAGLAANEDERQMSEQRYQFSNHPRDRVSWYQAIAFCRWLSWRLGGGYGLDRIDEWAVRLPTEFEWEKAARGTDGLEYVYGKEYDPAKGNTRETGIGQTSAVGIFPHGASPYEVMDMSGNAWEWCLSSYKNPAREAQKENLRSTDSRVLRGGSWFNYQVRARAAGRLINHPADRGDSIGVRLVCCVRPPSLL
ncbi:MAG: SUMF1/EgtB/PvdO family nonheme iron enzyme [Blastocatellia bacterium]